MNTKKLPQYSLIDLKAQKITNPKPRGSHPSACSGMFIIIKPLQKAEPHRCPGLRTTVGRLHTRVVVGRKEQASFTRCCHGTILQR